MQWYLAIYTVTIIKWLDIYGGWMNMEGPRFAATYGIDLPVSTLSKHNINVCHSKTTKMDYYWFRIIHTWTLCDISGKFNCGGIFEGSQYGRGITVSWYSYVGNVAVLELWTLLCLHDFWLPSRLAAFYNQLAGYLKWRYNIQSVRKSVLGSL